MHGIEKSATDQQSPLVYSARIVERRHDVTWNGPEQRLFAHSQRLREELGKLKTSVRMWGPFYP